MAAHLGGLFSGFFLGYGFYFSLIYHRHKKILKPVTICMTVLITIFSSFGVIKSLKKSDFLQFHEIVNEYVVLEKSINDLVRQMPLYQPFALKFFNSNILPKWEEALRLSQKIKLLSMSKENEKSREHIVEWISLSYTRACLVAELTDQNGSKNLKKINSINERLKKLNETAQL
jgi:hypothetical protein